MQKQEKSDMGMSSQSRVGTRDAAVELNLRWIDVEQSGTESLGRGEQLLLH